MKHLCLILLLLKISTATNAQYLQPLIDSAVNIRYPDGLVPVEGYDSVQNAILRNYIQKEVLPKQEFCWPSHAIKTSPSTTYRYLLTNKYKITGPISHGCVTPAYQYSYDTIIANVLRKKFGNYFFERSKKEADLLDTNKMGLTLPYLKDQKENLSTIIHRALPFTDTFRFKNTQDSLQYIFLYFKDGKIKEATFGEQVWGIQTSLDLLEYSSILTEILNKLKWQYPTFKKNLQKQLFYLI